MAAKGIEMSLVLVLVLMLWGGAAAQTQSGCTRVLMGLSPCLNYVTGNSSTPSSSCCSNLASVVQSQPRCLCSLLNGGGTSMGFNINQTLAMALPGACNVQTPSVSQCNSANGPTTSATSPTSSPADSSNETPETPTTTSVPSIPSGTGSKTVPTTSGSTSDGSMTKLPHLTIFVPLIFACFSSFISF
ncbi:non-specific lipid transfer protein GPI-anchored 5-like [Cornus florida]|uniref:non-specific lipid transfer protein GPI-anchored 5-like n=1 Tax=Cornus florida TaxID=4283 RepID=UPI0028A154D3|nr:non-specific lipid transfer protein GPI-anchored 5-like [Cornus florida]